MRQKATTIAPHGKMCCAFINHKTYFYICIGVTVRKVRNRMDIKTPIDRIYGCMESYIEKYIEQNNKGADFSVLRLDIPSAYFPHDGERTPMDIERLAQWHAFLTKRMESFRHPLESDKSCHEMYCRALHSIFTANEDERYSGETVAEANPPDFKKMAEALLAYEIAKKASQEVEEGRSYGTVLRKRYLKSFADRPSRGK